jgi:hypothetical protein
VRGCRLRQAQGLPNVATIGPDGGARQKADANPIDAAAGLKETTDEAEKGMVDPRNDNGSRRRSFVGLAMIVLLFVVGWVLVHELYAGEQLEDCLLSGRTNCAPIQDSGH